MSAELGRLKADIAKFAAERGWKRFHTPKNLAMAMSVEAAEVSELFQWLTPAASRRLPKDKKAALADELADTYVYLLMLAKVYDIDLISAARAKVRKNRVKYPKPQAGKVRPASWPLS